MPFPRRLLPTLAIAATLTLSCKDKPAENVPDAAAATPPVASSVAPLATAPPASASASASPGRDEGGRRGHGPAAMLFVAARGLELKDEQKAKIEAAEKNAHSGAGDASKDAMKDASKELHTELIAGIKAGKIENAKLEPKYAAIEKVAAAAHEKEAEALNALHAALDTTQRKAVATSVRAKQTERETQMAGRKDRDTGAGGDGGAADGGKGGQGGKRALERLTRGLELDAEQQKKIDAIAAKDDGKGGRPDMAEMKKKMEALLGAFEKDTFDAKKADAFDGKKARGPMAQQASLLAQVVPILKPEQREKLATQMEKGPRGPGAHGRRGGSPGAPGGHRPPVDDDDDD